MIIIDNCINCDRFDINYRNLEITIVVKMTLKKVKLGSAGLEVSRLGLGTMGMTAFYNGEGDFVIIYVIIHLCYHSFCYHSSVDHLSFLNSFPYQQIRSYSLLIDLQ